MASYCPCTCRKVHAGRKTRSHGHSHKHAAAPKKRRRTKYEACMSHEMKHTIASDQASKMHLVMNACGRYRKKGKKKK